MTHQLCEPILDRQARTTHFFNGRLLTAEDLQLVQAADARHRDQLGRALGSGVVEGLQVSLKDASAATPSTLTIAAGPAPARDGGALELAGPVHLALVPPPSRPDPQPGD